MSVQARTYNRCVSISTAASYNLPALANSLKRTGFQVRLTRDMLHLNNTRNGEEIFFFDHGSFVCWGLTKKKEMQWVEEVKEFSVRLLPKIEMDHFCFMLGSDISIDTHERFKLDIITLSEAESPIKLAISYGLAQSIKLETFEDTVQRTVQKNAYLPSEIAKKGNISLTRKAIFKRVGEIFEVRSSINLSSEYLDTPEYFWRNPILEPYYIMTKQFLDLPSRVGALNQRLDVLQELLDILNDQVHHSHSSMLETTIIILILIEIVISLISMWHYWL